MASEMIGEILKLAISVTLVTVFSLGVYAYLPEERVPYLEIETSWNASDPNIVDITHVGGDTIQSSEIKIQMRDPNSISNAPDPKDLSELGIDIDFWRFPEALSINTSYFFTTPPDNVNVIVIHPRAILAEGDVKKK